MPLQILMAGFHLPCGEKTPALAGNGISSIIAADTVQDAGQALDILAQKQVDILIMEKSLAELAGKPFMNAVMERSPACHILMAAQNQCTGKRIDEAGTSASGEGHSTLMPSFDQCSSTKAVLISRIQEDALLADIRDGYRIPEPVADRLFETRKRYEAVLSDYGFVRPDEGRLYLILNFGVKDSLGNEEIRAVGLLMRRHLGNRMVHHIACLSKGGEIDWFIQTTKDCSQSDVNSMMGSIRTTLDNLWGWRLYFAISAPLRHSDDLYAIRQRMRRALIEMQLKDEQFVRSFPDNRLNAGPGDGVVESVKAYLESKLRQEISLTELSVIFGYHPDYLSRFFRRSMGMTMIQYHARKQMELVAGMLRDQTMPISDIARETGFSSMYHFSRTVRKHLGVSPTGYRRQALLETQMDKEKGPQPNRSEQDAPPSAEDSAH